MRDAFIVPVIEAFPDIVHQIDELIVDGVRPGDLVRTADEKLTMVRWRGERRLPLVLPDRAWLKPRHPAKAASNSRADARSSGQSPSAMLSWTG